MRQGGGRVTAPPSNVLINPNQEILMRNLGLVNPTAEDEIKAAALESASLYAGDGESFATDLNQLQALDEDFVLDEESGLHFFDSEEARKSEEDLHWEHNQMVLDMACDDDPNLEKFLKALDEPWF